MPDNTKKPVDLKSLLDQLKRPDAQKTRTDELDKEAFDKESLANKVESDKYAGNPYRNSPKEEGLRDDPVSEAVVTGGASALKSLAMPAARGALAAGRSAAAFGKAELAAGRGEVGALGKSSIPRPVGSTDIESTPGLWKHTPKPSTAGGKVNILTSPEKLPTKTVSQLQDEMQVAWDSGTNEGRKEAMRIKKEITRLRESPNAFKDVDK